MCGSSRRPEIPTQNEARPRVELELDYPDRSALPENPDAPALPAADDPTQFFVPNAIPIPTLSPIGLALLILALAGLTVFRLRRRRL